MISSAPEVLRRLEQQFELGQIWITDPGIGDLATTQQERMYEQFDTVSIPLHVVVDPLTNEELSRFRYGATVTPQDYLDFLDAGLAAFRTAHPDLR